MRFILKATISFINCFEQLSYCMCALSTEEMKGQPSSWSSSSAPTRGAKMKMFSLAAQVAAGGMAVVAVWLVVEFGLLLEARVGDGESEVLQERSGRSLI